MSTGDFTLDAWFNPSAFTAGQLLISKDTYGSNFDWCIDIINNNVIALYTSRTNNSLIVTVPTMTVGTWYHVAIVKNAGVVTIFLDGISYGSKTMGITNESQYYVTIGCGGWNNPNSCFNGYIDELRVSKGIARWTSNFTPPTAEYVPVSPTPTPTPDPPISNGVDDISSVSLLHFNGAHNSLTITDENGKTWNRFYNARLSTYKSKFGGASGLFSANGDYLSTGPSNDFNFGSDSFTIDLWVYFNITNKGYQMIVSHRNSSANYEGWVLYLESNNVLQFIADANGGAGWDFVLGTGMVPAANTWMHIAVVRNGSVWTIYVDGVAKNSINSAAAIMNLSSNTYIGSDPGGAYPLEGYVDELRITKGVARWTSNFTPPTSQYVPPGGSNFITASGGRVRDTEDGYRTHTFTSSGSLLISSQGTAQILAVGGGGGGMVGKTSAYYAAGGGGGEVIYNSGASLNTGLVSVRVGAGGASLASNILDTNGNNGVDSGFGVVLARKGLGANFSTCIGGTSGDGVHIGGSPVGSACGGGGGASLNGNNATGADAPGSGGSGLSYSIGGYLQGYGGGGGGTSQNNAASGGTGGGGNGLLSGFSYTGGGGGGGKYNVTPGGGGGSGIVVVKYKLPDPILQYVTAIGGTITDVNGNRIHTFTSSGTFTVTNGGAVNLLVVGGGGGGTVGKTNTYYGAAGGGGEVVYRYAYPVTPGVYTVVVGTGGAVLLSSVLDVNGNDGIDSSFDSIVASKGFGGNVNSCIGGASGDGVHVGGYSTGKACGGGAGAGGYGFTAPDADSPGAGGDGVAFSITGALTYYGGGGGSTSQNNAGAGGLGGGGAGYLSATPNTGGGGGGGRYLFANGGAGGSGVVIVQYQLPPIVNAIPQVSNVQINGGATVNLSAGSTATVSCTGTVVDTDGFPDIQSVTATFYKTSVGINASDNINTHYTRAGDAQCMPANGAANSEDYTCDFQVYYLADPTDAASSNPNDTWSCAMHASDGKDTSQTETVTIDINTLIAIEASAAINYGVVNAGSNSGSTNNVTNVVNVGNSAIDLYISGTDMCSNFPTCTGDKIVVSNQQFSTTAFTYGAGTALSVANQFIPANISKSSVHPSDQSFNVYWGIAIPVNQQKGSYVGINTVSAVSH